jgi:hypothetical protein
MSTKRAQRVYLSFFESDDDNGSRIAIALNQALQEVFPVDSSNYTYTALYDELKALIQELKDPTLLTDIYGEVDEL